MQNAEVKGTATFGIGKIPSYGRFIFYFKGDIAVLLK